MTKNRIERARRAAVVLMAAGLFTTGCTVDGDAAAQVGTDRLTQAQLSSLTDVIMAADPEADRASVNRSQLTSHIRHELLLDLADARQIVVTDAEIQAQLADFDLAAVAAQLGISEADVPNAVFDSMVLQQLAEAALESPVEGELVTVEADTIEVPDQAAAAVLQAQLLGPNAEQILKGRSAEVVPETLSNVDPATAGAGVFGVFDARADDVLVVEDEGRYIVVRVNERTSVVGPVDLMPFAQVRNGLTLVAPLLLSAQALDSGVTVNPRFGHWDPVAVAVVP